MCWSSVRREPSTPVYSMSSCSPGDDVAMTREAINTKATAMIHERREPGLPPSHAEIGLLYDDTLRRLYMSSDRDCEKDAQHDDQPPPPQAFFLDNLAAVLQQLYAKWTSRWSITKVPKKTYQRFTFLARTRDSELRAVKARGFNLQNALRNRGSDMG